MFKEIDSYDQLRYPEDFQAVLRGDAYYYPEPINILGYYKKFCELGSYRIIDLAHPKCYYCGKFVKAGDWWKGLYSGPCKDCYDYIGYPY